MNKVTDPLLLMQLNGDVTIKGEFSPDDKAAILEDYQKTMANKPKMVTDKLLLQQLNQNSVQLDPTGGMSTADKFLAGAGMGMTNLARGAGQRLRDIAGNDFGDRFGLPTEADITEARRLDAPLKDTTAGTVGDFIGGALPLMALPGGTLKQAIGTGLTAGALQPTTDNESVIKNALIGGAGGALGQGAIAGAGRLLRPVRSELSPELSALAQKAQEQGIDLNAAQLSGSRPLKWIDSVMDDLPLTAGAQQAAKEAQRKQFNGAISKTMGSEADNLGEDVMAQAKARIGGNIGDIAKRNDFNLDNQAFTDLVKNKFEAQKFETSDVQNIVNNYIDDFFSKVGPDGKVSGEAYRKLDSHLGKRMRETSNGDLRHALGEVRTTLRSAMDRSITPDDAANWQLLRNQYRNMKLIEPVAKKSVDGNISPAALLGAAIKGDSNAAYSSSALKDLGKIGKAFLQEPPSSGTEQRQFYRKLLTSGGLTGGLASVGGILGGIPGAGSGAILSGLLNSGLLALPVQKAMNSKAGKEYLTKGMLKSLQWLEDPLARYAPALGAQGLLTSLQQ